MYNSLSLSLEENCVKRKGSAFNIHLSYQNCEWMHFYFRLQNEKKKKF